MSVFAAAFVAVDAVKRRRPEQTLQIQVANYLRVALRPPVWWSSIDHGVGKLGKAEAGLRKARGVKAGLPDIVIISPNPRVTLGIELKAPKGKQSTAQIKLESAWTDAGAEYWLADNLLSVQGILEFCNIPIHARISA